MPIISIRSRKSGQNGVDQIGRRNEHDFGQVEGHAQIVVCERVVLFRVEHFEQGGGGIAAKIHADLVDFVQHEDRVVGAGLFHALNDAAGERADIGASMAADLGFITDAAETDADKFAAEGAGDRLPERGLSDARGPDETEDRALHFIFEFPHGEILKDPFLHFFQIVVVLVEDFGGGLQVEVVLGFLGPGQFHDPFDIGPDGGGLGGIRVHFSRRLSCFSVSFSTFSGIFGVCDPLAKLSDFFRAFIEFAQLFLNRFELFAQEVFALGLVHLALGLGLDLLLHGEDFDFLAEDLADMPEAFDRIDDLQDCLGDLDLEAEIGRDHVGKPSGVFEIFDDDHHVRDEDFAETHDPFDLFFDRPHGGFGFKGGAGRLVSMSFVDAHGIIGIGLDVALNLGFREPLHENFDAFIGQFQHPHDDADRADGMDIFR